MARQLQFTFSEPALNETLDVSYSNYLRTLAMLALEPVEIFAVTVGPGFYRLHIRPKQRKEYAATNEGMAGESPGTVKGKSRE